MDRPEHQILIIFGASGDLAKRKLLPALYELYANKLLPEKFAILGIGRTSYDDQSYRSYMEESLQEFAEKFEGDKDFIHMLHYLSMDPSEESDYDGLVQKLEEIRQTADIPDRYIFYLATPPSLYELIPRYLHKHDLTSEKKGTWKRMIIEKPFGLDLASAKDLNRKLLEELREDQVYRIDHYLGKETVQNILVTRFSNGIYEPLWNRNYIDRIEITSAESQGVGSRGGYYDRWGTQGYASKSPVATGCPRGHGASLRNQFRYYKERNAEGISIIATIRKEACGKFRDQGAVR